MAAGSDDTFTTATAVVADEATQGRYLAHIPVTWSTPGGVHGGMLVAAGLNAARTAVDRPELTMRVAHAMFLSPPSNDLVFDVEVLRQGRGSAHVRVRGTCVAQDQAAIDITAIFTAGIESREWLDSEPPDAAAPDAYTSDVGRTRAPGIAMQPPPLMDHLDLRSVLGLAPWDENWRPGQPARHVRWSRYRHTPRLADRTVDPTALLPLADLPGSAVWVKGPPEEMPIFFMSLDLSISFLEPVPDDWVLADIRARRLREGHVYVETDLWSDDRLVATSTQTMLRRRVPPNLVP